MTITELYIENFGKLSGVRLNFTDGINTVCEPNGYGKTTLTAFIKAMFYGLGDTKRAPLSENDRKHYMPWQGGRCGGSLTFRSERGLYRIERTFCQKASDDTCTIADAATGRPTADYSERVGEELFGIDADGFERTLFLSERDLPEKNENKSIAAKLSDLTGTDGDVGNLDDALALLDERRKFYYKKGGSGEIRNLEERLSALDLALSDIERKETAAEETHKKITGLTKEIAELRQTRASLSARREAQSLAEQRRGYAEAYQRMKNELSAEEVRLADLRRFFASRATDAAEIAEMTRLSAEAQGIAARHPAGTITGNENAPSLLSLTDADEVSEMKATAARLVERERDIRRIRDSVEGITESGKLRRLPTDAEIDEQIRALTGESSHKSKKTRHAPAAILLTAGLAALVCGAALGLLVAPPMWALAVPGAVLILCGIPLCRKRNKAPPQADAEKEALAFYRDITGHDPSEETLTASLVALKSEAEDARYTARRAAERRAEADRIEENATALREELLRFLSRLGCTDTANLPAAVQEVESRLRAESSKRQELRIRRENDARDAERLIALRQSLTAFCAAYPTVTDDPLAEINRRYLEWQLAEETVAKNRAVVEEFRKKHDLSETETVVQSTENDLGAQIADADRSLDSLSSALTLARGEYDRLLRATEERDALLIEKSETEEKHNEACATLDIVRRTASYLTEAGERLTSRYLERTKRAFLAYLTAVEDDAAPAEDYTMDTAFSIRHSDRGELHPTEAYSRGTRALYGLAVRFALVDALYDREIPPLLLDDPFLSLDDARLERAKNALKKLAKRHQILYLTCAKARSIH